MELSHVDMTPYAKWAQVQAQTSPEEGIHLTSRGEEDRAAKSISCAEAQVCGGRKCSPHISVFWLPKFHRETWG